MATIDGTVGGGGAAGDGDCRLGNRGCLYCGDILGNRGALSVLVVEEAEHRRCPVEGAVLAEERAIGEEAAPELADKGGSDEARRVFWWEAEEDLADEVIHELRWRRRRHPTRSLLDRGGGGWRMGWGILLWLYL